MNIKIINKKEISLEENENIFLSNKENLLSKTLIFKLDDFKLKTGMFLGEKFDEPLFQIIKICFLPTKNNLEEKIFILKSFKKQTLKKKNYDLLFWKKDFTLSCITISDKASKGLREDKSSKEIQNLIEKNFSISIIKNFIIPDETTQIKSLLSSLAYIEEIDIIITTGGTGISPRDITPEATKQVIEKRLYGFEQLMMKTALSKTPHAVISRAVVGSALNSLIINLPGSPKAVRKNLEAIIPAMKHTIEKLQGDTRDCSNIL